MFYLYSYPKETDLTFYKNWSLYINFCFWFKNEESDEVFCENDGDNASGSESVEESEDVRSESSDKSVTVVREHICSLFPG